jgi:predicted porin
MKKTMFMLGALAATGMAFAQSSVTLFGVVDLGYESVKTNAGRISGLAPSANTSSRIGFRGVEDLGGGLSASFWLEGAIAPASGLGSSGTTTQNQSTNVAAGAFMFNRRSTVSLSGAFGEVRLGRDYVPSFWNYTVFDPFTSNGVGASLGNYSGASYASTFVRASNSIGYFLPGNLGGFFGQAMYAMGNRASTETQAVPAAYGAAAVDTSSNGRYMGVRFGYASGPINTAIGYGRTRYAAGTNAISVAGIAGTSGDFTDFNWGGSYTFGNVKAMATLSQQKGEDVGAPGVARKTRTWGIGANVGVGAGNVLAQYSAVRVDGGPRGKKFALGYTHNLSKRTAVYGVIARVTNSGGAAFTAASFSSGALGAVGGAVNVNGKSTGYDVGLKHSF